MPAARTPLYGRHEAAGRIERCLDALVDGHDDGCRRSAMIVVEGVAGLGKTRLVEHAVAAAGVRLVTTFSGRAEEVARDRPFGPLLDAFGVFADAGERWRK